MEIATPTFENDAFLHAGGRIRRWGEETAELPALQPDSTYVLRLESRRHAYRRIVGVVVGVLALVAVVGLAVGPSFRAETGAPEARRAVRTAVTEPTPLVDTKRPIAHPRRVRRGR